MLTTILRVGYLFWRYRKQRFPALFARINFDMQTDADFLIQLRRYDKATLEYALLQYRNCWNNFDSRIGLFVGDFLRIGLFPALTALIIAVSTLIKNDDNVYLWMPLVLSVCFYGIAFYAHAQRGRPQQVVELLEYAVRYAEIEVTPHPAKDFYRKQRFFRTKQFTLGK